jgi:hypothetical protein
MRPAAPERAQRDTGRGVCELIRASDVFTATTDPMRVVIAAVAAR